MSRKAGLFLFLICKLSVSLKIDATGKFEDVCAALNLALDFVGENLRDFNIDGVFGLILAEAQLQEILDPCSTRARNKLSKILQTVNFDSIEVDAKKKLFIRYLLDRNTWKKDVNFTLGKISGDSYHNMETCQTYSEYMRSDDFVEGLSDDCFVNLIVQSVKAPHRCRLNKLCQNYMVDRDDIGLGYGVTHRVLFLQVSEARGCNWNIEMLEKKIANYCSYILWEARWNERCGFIPQLNDLFLEQVMLCGYEGFVEFFAGNWTEHILNIQNEHGCFGSSQVNKPKTKNKREANVIKYGCLDHTTGLGVAVLSLILRFLATSYKL